MNAAQPLQDLLQRPWLDNIARTRRIAAGFDAKVVSVVSLFVSRWGVAVNGGVPHDAALAADPQCEGTVAFARSWRDLMQRIASTIEEPAKADRA